MKVMLKVDHENGRIVMNRTFANLAANVFSEEYKILQGARQDYPTYVVVRRTIKKNPNRECYRGLTYDYMRDYISRYEPEESRESVRAELEDMIQISRCHSRCKRYPVIKQWFLEKYPDVKKLWDGSICGRRNREHHNAFCSCSRSRAGRDQGQICLIRFF